MAGDVINYSNLRVPTSGALLDYLFFNLRFLNIVGAINGIAARQDGYDATLDTLVSAGLTQVNSVLGPLLTKLQLASQNGFLAANAEGPSVSLSTAGTVLVPIATQFTISSVGMGMFTPTPWLMVVDENDYTNWGILKFTSYNPVSGVLAGGCVYAAKTQASTKWTISCSSAVIPAMMTMLAAAQTASSAAVAAEASVASQLVDLEAAIAAIAAGPVVSVCGHSGAVVLGIADITNLASTIAGLVTTAALSSGLASKQPSASVLSVLSALTFGADTLPYATSSSTVSTTAFTPLARSLLACSDGPSMIAVIGAATLTGQFDDQSGTSYSFVAADTGKMITLTNAAAIAASLPNNLPKGWNALVYQGAAGVITFSVLSGATLRNRQNQYRTAGIYAVVSLLCVSNSDGASAVYVLGGDTQT